MILYNSQMEIWKKIPGLPSQYEASSLGRIRRLYYKKQVICRWTKILSDREFPTKILVCSKVSSKGYVRHTIEGKQWFAHRLIASAFIENLNNHPQVNHKNGNKLDNNPNNLEWVSNKENRSHAKDNGLIYRGERSNSKLNAESVKEIREMIKLGIPQSVIAKKFNVIQQTISHVKLNTWKHIKA